MSILSNLLKTSSTMSSLAISSIYITAMSVFDLVPSCLGTILNPVSFILLLTNAVLNLMVSVKPSLEPLNTVSPDGSVTPLVGQNLVDNT
uniref:Uncharacterized protein n=1 Tax=Clostridium sp. RKD TaxID=295236 RepID=Q5ZFQ3_9CLOT|nr:hypothetical protein [Clostridium sp. RKD]